MIAERVAWRGILPGQANQYGRASITRSRNKLRLRKVPSPSVDRNFELAELEKIGFTERSGKFSAFGAEKSQNQNIVFREIGAHTA